jgi:hypothetical protein
MLDDAEHLQTSDYLLAVAGLVSISLSLSGNFEGVRYASLLTCQNVYLKSMTCLSESNPGSVRGMLIITRDFLGHLTEHTRNMSIANKVVVLCKHMWLPATSTHESRGHIPGP